MANISKITEELGRSPTLENWERFRKALASSGIKYYSIKFPEPSLKGLEDLRSAYAELYDSRGRPIFRVPIIMSSGKGVRGATSYLKGLLNLNRWPS